jgi:hypothetical protein
LRRILLGPFSGVYRRGGLLFFRTPEEYRDRILEEPLRPGLAISPDRIARAYKDGLGRYWILVEYVRGYDLYKHFRLAPMRNAWRIPRITVEASPANVTLSRGGSATITLRLRAILLETPENGVILIVADPSACRMTNITTTTRIANITYTTMTLIGGRMTSVVTVCTSQKKWECYWGTITYIADPTTVIAANVSVSYTTENVTRVNDFIAQPEPITLTFTTRTTATITRTMILNAKSLDYWDPSASCYVWFRVMNATGGSRLAEAGVKVLAGAP